MSTLFFHSKRHSFYYRSIIPRRLRPFFKGRVQVWRSLQTVVPRLKCRQRERVSEDAGNTVKSVQNDRGGRRPWTSSWSSRRVLPDIPLEVEPRKRPKYLEKRW